MKIITNSKINFHEISLHPISNFGQKVKFRVQCVPDKFLCVQDVRGSPKRIDWKIYCAALTVKRHRINAPKSWRALYLLWRARERGDFIGPDRAPSWTDQDGEAKKPLAFIRGRADRKGSPSERAKKQGPGCFVSFPRSGGRALSPEITGALLLPPTGT